MRFVRDFFEIFGDLEMREAVAPETTIYIHTHLSHTHARTHIKHNLSS